ncbi:MAG: hypothetical protein GY895_03845 [Phycisphaera sp.]|nr:hypothetical protein [Phycisphaera sp.]
MGLNVSIPARSCSSPGSRMRPVIGALLILAAGLPACTQEIQRSQVVSVLPGQLADAALEGPSPVETEPAGTTAIESAGEIERGDGSFREDEDVRLVGEDGVLVDERIVVNDLPVGMPYPVDGLVGQINGRPVFADEFLLPLEDRILRIVAERPIAQAVREVDRLVALRFEEYVNSELIIAEAESMLSTDQQQGVLAWLQGVQDQTITDRGGTRDSAASSIEDEFGIGFEEFMSQRRSVALAQDLLQKRVQPRAIVSWRDVEQAYRRDYADFNPPAKVSIGRLRLHRERESEQVAVAEQLFAEGTGFMEVIEVVEPGSDGEWLELELPPDGLAGTSLATKVKDRLDLERVGEVGESLEQGPFVSWFTVLGIEQPPGRSIFDPSVQIGLENQLAGLRYSQEQSRYLDGLKDRWVAGDILQMRTRLLEISRARYFSAR